MADTPQLATIGTIAARFKAPVHQIEYVIRTRRIVAAVKLGNAWVYDEAAVAKIGLELRRIASGRQR